MSSTVPFIPDHAPFNAAQRLWLNGFLAGLFAKSPITADPAAIPEATGPSLLILFGTQTGTAEVLARRIAKEAKAVGCGARVVDAAAHATIEWPKETHLLIVTSTYGDGDMPDNAQGFWDWLQTDAASGLAHLHFSVLALGDTNYSEFCAAGKKIDARLEQIGARRIHPRADCNVDYEAEAKLWVEGALGALSPSARNGRPAADPLPGSRSTAREAYSKTNPFPAPLLTNRRLTGEGSGKETRHFELSLEGSGLTYESGDALGVHPVNCPMLVDNLLETLGCDGEEAVPAPASGELPLRKALKESYDITKPSPELLRRVAEFHPVLNALLATGREGDLKKWLWGRELIDLLIETPALRFKPAELVALLKKLAPRLYSISSSPSAHAGQVHVTVGIVRHESNGRQRKGVCSTYLADRVAEPTPVFIKSSPGFRLPPAGDTPIIMVGPGTGIAPFRSFLHERQATGAKGRNWLFFGEQRAATDFFYREELESMLADGPLTKLCTAFSRDQADKLYVQHRMLEHAGELWAWLNDGAHFYVCGDASRMAKDVDAALHQAIQTAGGLGREAAAEFVQQLKSGKRYQRDVY